MLESTESEREFNSNRPGGGRRVGRLLLIAALVLVVAGFVSAWAALRVVRGRYEGRIYPHVAVLGVDVGELTPEEAAARIAGPAGEYDAGALTLSGYERQWTVPWSEVGLVVDVRATAEAAYAVGRSDSSPRTVVDVLMNPHEIEPVVALEPAAARAVLERMAPDLVVAPTDATLRLEGDRLVAVPGQQGWELNVDATLENLLAGFDAFGAESGITLVFEFIPPEIADAGPAQARGEEMLRCEVRVSTYDVLTDETVAWTLGRDVVLTWLRVAQAEDGSGPTVRIDEGAVRATLADLDRQLGAERTFDSEEALAQVLGAFEAGGGEVELPMIHAPRSYLVQSGDTLATISARFGMPPGLIVEANPDVDLDMLSVGQELLVPSQAVLTPYRPVPGKRIVIGIEQQRMWVYENGQLLYDWPVSTGLPGSPTYTGEFQILSQEDNAYAGQWDLWMPHFMGVYRAGGQIYNGIHALPILSNGQRLWEGNLGSPASFGCIILGIEEAEILYDWAEIGVPVTIE
jgi:lipoprotein-anchoring transpeptidase ErfK/SrfK